LGFPPIRGRLVLQNGRSGSLFGILAALNGSIYKKKGGGSAVLWHNEDEKKKSRFDGLLTEDCHIKRCVRNGVNADISPRCRHC
jgi:hypothetical protein